MKRTVTAACSSSLPSSARDEPPPKASKTAADSTPSFAAFAFSKVSKVGVAKAANKQAASSVAASTVVAAAATDALAAAEPDCLHGEVNLS